MCARIKKNINTQMLSALLQGSTTYEVNGCVGTGLGFTCVKRPLVASISRHAKDT